MERQPFLDELSQDLQPVKRARRPVVAGGLWLLAAWALVVVATVATGPLRPGAFGQLAESPRFAIETLLALLGGAAAIWGVLELGIPAPRALWRRLLPGCVLLLSWVGLLVYGLWDPALPLSMAGKRADCALQALVFSLPPLAMALVALRRRVTLQPAWAGALAGAAAAALPALAMQFGCMYHPEHDLLFHLGPGLVTVALGALLGWRLLPRI